MNACCGHGDFRIAYIQYWNRSRIAGNYAIAEQERLIMQESRNRGVEGSDTMVSILMYCNAIPMGLDHLWFEWQINTRAPVSHTVKVILC